MGVQGLWSLLGPAARPTQLESLRQKKIAVDASIWIHQFMRTMRDKEGNALKNGHLLGFFRRICKLLFYDIKPVFVFDGGAPALKRSTIRERRKRREGIKVNLKATAKKILSAQAKSRVLLEEERKQRGENVTQENENFVYVEELEKTAEVLRKTKKLDQYELPEIDSKKAYDRIDPRLATVEEIQSFVDEFSTADLDIDSETFQSLPPEVQYEVIQDLKNKSRQTSWARLDQMVRGSKTALDFSKHQIKLLKHRNTMTQRMMQMNTVAGGEAESAPTRIAGERGRQYVLYKNESIDEGLGWKLPGLTVDQPVILDHPEPKLEIPVKKVSPPPEEDKVKAALASNPKLAALFSDFMSDEDEDDEVNDDQEDEDMMEKIIEVEEDEPLFVTQTEYEEEPEIINDMRAYMEDEDNDEAINQVISRIYQKEKMNESPNVSKQQQEKDSILLLNSNDFINLWVSRMPDAFLYLHSLNEEHTKLLHSAVKEKDIPQLEIELKSVRKQFGKTNEGDELALESLQFHESFLESTINWKYQNTEPFNDDFEEVVLEEKSPKVTFDIEKHLASPNKNISSIVIDDDSDGSIEFTSKEAQSNNEDIVLTDDDDDEDIQFLPANPTINENKSPREDTENMSEPVSIDFRQSLLITEGPPKITNLDDSHSDNDDDIFEVISEKKSAKTNPNDVNTLDNTDIKSTVKENKNPSAEVVNKEIDEALERQIIEANEEKIQQSKEKVPDRGYNSEDELEDHAFGEEDEYARFVSDIASKQLDDVRSELYRDMKELNKQQRKDMGNSDDVTDQMVKDIQELLKLFGIPFIVSPMEAEAQCAELESLKLIDGTITDDSDVFLFGASRVYKNMFNQQRFVECYMSHDIEREMLLSRKTLIQLAFLLGSDYTDGIPGVGPVAAMEILSEFSSTKTSKEEEGDEEEEEDDTVNGPLIRFKEWYNSGIDTTAFQRKFRKSHKDIDIPDDFPSSLVQSAYYHPTVDHSTQKFEWGQPQLDSLRIFLTEAFGWSEEKADQVLLPVLREMNNKKTTGEQQILGSYFNTTGTVSSSTNNAGNNQYSQKHSSKRVRSIVEKWRSQKKAKKSSKK